MRKVILISFFIGLAIGIAQLFFVYERTRQNVQVINTNNPICLAMSPECGVCIYEERDGKCYEPKYTQKYKGFPFSSGAYGRDSRIDTTALLYVNILLWATGVPVCSYIVSKLKNNLQKSK